MNGVDRTQARRLTRISQVAAAVLAAGAAMAFLVEPGLPERPPMTSGEPLNEPRQQSGSVQPVEFDIALASDMLNQAGEVTPEFPQDEPVPPVDVVEVEPVTPPTASGTSSNYRFLGGFFSSERSLAIITVSGTQKMVRVGDPVDFGYTVKSITPEVVELERDGEIERLDRQTPSGAMVATTGAIGTTPDRVAPGTQVSQSARDRLRNARTEANARTQTDRAKLRADYERQRQERIEELREQGIEVDDAEWQRDD